MKYSYIIVFYILQQIEPDSTDFDAAIVTMHEEEIKELKAKFLRHKEILKSNCDQAESEVIRLDEIYHDTVDMVLKVDINITVNGEMTIIYDRPNSMSLFNLFCISQALNAIPEIVESNEELSKIKTSLESSLATDIERINCQLENDATSAVEEVVIAIL